LELVKGIIKLEKVGWSQTHSSNTLVVAYIKVKIKWVDREFDSSKQKGGVKFLITGQCPDFSYARDIR
jgi:hypothetical protein